MRMRDTWRSVPPREAASFAVALPGFERLEAPDGTAVYLAPRPDVGGVSLELVIDAGARHEPRGRGGLADLVAWMLPLGTGGGDRASLAASFGDLGGDLYVTADYHCLRVGTQVLARSAASALALLGDVASYPTMPPSGLARQQARLAREPAVGVADLARLAAYEVFAPGASPWANIRRTARDADVDLLRAMLASGFGRRPRAVIVAGGFAPGPAAEWVGEMVSHLPAAGPEVEVGTRLPIRRTAEPVVLVDRPGDKVVLSLATLAPPIGGRDEVPFELATGVVRNSLYDELRGREGLTYAVVPSTESTAFGRMLRLWAIMEPRDVTKALRRVLESLQAVRSSTVSDRWVHQVRTSGVVAAMNGFQSNSQLVHGARWLHIRDRPPDYYQAMVDEIGQVEGQDVTRVLGSWFGSEAVSFVLVGPLDVLRRAVERAWPDASVKVMSRDRLV